ncbi:MAG: hypothetical protein AAF802_06230 [Planctomycetota bacterium]
MQRLFLLGVEVMIVVVASSAMLMRIRPANFAALLPVTIERSAVLEAAQQDTSRFKQYRFDPLADVLLDGGPDGKPGVLGLDDNADGIIDDLSELGAVGSDDVCLAPFHPPYAEALARTESGETLSVATINYGAFVECDAQEESTRYFEPTLGWIIGQ